MTDTLNISFHTRRLLIKALNTIKSKKDAATALGISERHIYRLMDMYHVGRDKKTKQYYYTEKIQ